MIYPLKFWLSLGFISLLIFTPLGTNPVWAWEYGNTGINYGGVNNGGAAAPPTATLEFAPIVDTTNTTVTTRVTIEPTISTTEGTTSDSSKDATQPILTTKPTTQFTVTPTLGTDLLSGFEYTTSSTGYSDGLNPNLNTFNPNRTFQYEHLITFAELIEMAQGTPYAGTPFITLLGLLGEFFEITGLHYTSGPGAMWAKCQEAKQTGNDLNQLCQQISMMILNNAMNDVNNNSPTIERGPDDSNVFRIQVHQSQLWNLDIFFYLIRAFIAKQPQYSSVTVNGGFIDSDDTTVAYVRFPGPDFDARLLVETALKVAGLPNADLRFFETAQIAGGIGGEIQGGGAGGGVVEPGDPLGEGNSLIAIGNTWSLARTGLYNTGETGDGVVIAVLDTGVNPYHPDFYEDPNNPAQGSNLLVDCSVNNIYSFIPNCQNLYNLQHNYIDDPDNRVNPIDIRDFHGHGTAVAGLIAARQDNRVGIKGGAPLAKILSIRVLDENGLGSEAYVAMAIRSLINLSGPDGEPLVDIILLPLTTQGIDSLRAIEEAHGQGITVVVAAGNDNVEVEPYSLASSPYAIVVGATTVTSNGGDITGETPAVYTNTGRPDVAAPGGVRMNGEPIPDMRVVNNILAHLSNPFNDGEFGSFVDRGNGELMIHEVGNGDAPEVPGYSRNGGTSYAAAHVASLIAQIISSTDDQGFDWDPELIRSILKNTVVDNEENISLPNPRQIGSGRIDAVAAVQRADDMPLCRARLLQPEYEPIYAYEGEGQETLIDIIGTASCGAMDILTVPISTLSLEYRVVTQPDNIEWQDIMRQAEAPIPQTNNGILHTWNLVADESLLNQTVEIRLTVTADFGGMRDTFTDTARYQILALHPAVRWTTNLEAPDNPTTLVKSLILHPRKLRGSGSSSGDVFAATLDGRIFELSADEGVNGHGGGQGREILLEGRIISDLVSGHLKEGHRTLPEFFVATEDGSEYKIHGFNGSGSLLSLFPEELPNTGTPYEYIAMAVAQGYQGEMDQNLHKLLVNPTFVRNGENPSPQRAYLHIIDQEGDLLRRLLTSDEHLQVPAGSNFAVSDFDGGYDFVNHVWEYGFSQPEVAVPLIDWASASNGQPYHKVHIYNLDAGAAVDDTRENYLFREIVLNPCAAFPVDPCPSYAFSVEQANKAGRAHIVAADLNIVSNNNAGIRDGDTLALYDDIAVVRSYFKPGREGGFIEESFLFVAIRNEVTDEYKVLARSLGENTSGSSPLSLAHLENANAYSSPEIIVPVYNVAEDVSGFGAYRVLPGIIEGRFNSFNPQEQLNYQSIVRLFPLEDDRARVTNRNSLQNFLRNNLELSDEEADQLVTDFLDGFQIPGKISSVLAADVTGDAPSTGAGDKRQDLMITTAEGLVIFENRGLIFNTFEPVDDPDVNDDPDDPEADDLMGGRLALLRRDPIPVPNINNGGGTPMASILTNIQGVPHALVFSQSGSLSAFNLSVANGRRAEFNNYAYDWPQESGRFGTAQLRNPWFMRGDVNADLSFDISDPIALLGFLFLGTQSPSCSDTINVDGNEREDITDAVRILQFLFCPDCNVADQDPGGLPPSYPFRVMIDGQPTGPYLFHEDKPDFEFRDSFGCADGI